MIEKVFGEGPGIQVLQGFFTISVTGQRSTCRNAPGSHDGLTMEPTHFVNYFDALYWSWRGSADSQIRFAAQAFLLEVALLFAASFCAIGYRGYLLEDSFQPLALMP